MNFLQIISILSIISCLTVQPTSSFHGVMEKILYLHRLKQCWIFPLGKNCLDEDNIIDDAVGPQGNGPVGSSKPSTFIPEKPNSVLSTTLPTIIISEPPSISVTPTSTSTSEIPIFLITTQTPVAASFPTSIQVDEPKCPSGNTTITLQNLYNVPRQKDEQTSAEEEDIVNRNLHRLCNMDGFKCETNQDCGKNRKCCKVKFRKHSISSFVGPFFGACKICLFL